MIRLHNMRPRPGSTHRVKRLGCGESSGHGKTSGLDLGRMQTENATVFHVNEGKVMRLVVYWDGDRALADLGVEE